MLVVDTIKPITTLAIPIQSRSKWAYLRSVLPSVHIRLRMENQLLCLSMSTTGRNRIRIIGSTRFNTRERLALTAALFIKQSHIWLDVLFFLGGLAILVIHLHTTFVAASSVHNGCMLSMRSWLVTVPTCATLEINCVSGQHNDGRNIDSFRAVLTRVEPNSLKALVLSSCMHLHVPPVIHVLPALQMIKIYNSTIETWDTEAELRDVYHPNLIMVYFADTNFTNGEIPIGMLSDDAPHQLVDVEFSGSNLVRLPSDLHAKWPGIMYFVLERSPSITAFPTVLAEMKIPQLMLGSNSITSVPTDLLADQAFWKLMLDGNPLVQLPNAIGTVYDLYKVGFAYTNVTTLPDWAVVNASTSGGDDVPFLGYADLFGGGSPLCASPESIASATAALKVWFHLDCSLDAPTHAYPIEREREWRAASQATLC